MRVTPSLGAKRLNDSSFFANLDFSFAVFGLRGHAELVEAKMDNGA